MKLWGFRKKWKWIFFSQIVFISDFSVQIWNQCPKIDPCTKFQPNWTKGKEARILTSATTENFLMTWYSHHSGDVIKLLNVFERCCLRVPSCQVWWQFEDNGRDLNSVNKCWLEWPSLYWGLVNLSFVISVSEDPRILCRRFCDTIWQKNAAFENCSTV